ncbi:hypothetical protein [Roseospira navarrensis]
MAERHGGALWMEPTPGGGLTVLVRLPVAAQEPDGAPASAAG